MRSRAPNAMFSPVSAAGFFDQASQVSVVASGLEYRVYYSPPKYADGTVIVCHHGAGWSALTFAHFSKEVKSSSQGECGILAFDCRGHGMPAGRHSVAVTDINAKTGKTTSTAASSKPADMSINVLTTDLVNLVTTTFPDVKEAPTLLVCIPPSHLGS